MTPVLFALAAVAFLAWQSRTATAVLPPLVPATTFQAPESGKSGPHPLTLAAILAAGAMVAWAIRTPAPAPGPAPAPAPAVGLDLRGTFVGAEAASDAAITGELMAALADAISHDGTLKEPRLRSGQALAELRTAAREYRTQGVSLGSRQPLARDAIAAYLEREVGTDGGPIDAAARARWVAAFREVASAARAAGGR